MASYQAPQSLGFSRQEYWDGLPFASPGNLPNPGIKPTSLVSPALAGGFFTTSTTSYLPQGKLFALSFPYNNQLRKREKKTKPLGDWSSGWATVNEAEDLMKLCPHL